MHKEIVYPIFLEAHQYSENEVWSLFFEELSKGILPYGVNIKKKSIIYCSLKNKEFSYQFCDKTGKEVYTALYDIFKNKFRIDNQFSHVIYTNNSKLKVEKWSEIKKKSIRTILVENYVLQKKEEYDLSFPQIQKLFSNITLAIYFKLISTDHIEYDSQKCAISGINGITFDKHTIYFENIFSKIPGKVVQQRKN